jgi:hypothetical protein
VDPSRSGVTIGSNLRFPTRIVALRGFCGAAGMLRCRLGFLRRDRRSVLESERDDAVGKRTSRSRLNRREPPRSGGRRSKACWQTAD